jgi:hypothetical protein
MLLLLLLTLIIITSSIKQLKEELAQLEAEESDRDKIRALPLYSSKITGFKFVCSSCYDLLYQIAQQEQRRKKA